MTNADGIARETGRVSDTVAEYLDHVAALGRSRATVEAYRYRLAPLTAYASEHSLPLNGLTRRHVEQVGDRIAALPLAASSRAAFATALHGFLKWCAARGACPPELAAAVEVPRVPRALPPRPLTPRQVREIQDALPAGSASTVRNRAILGLMWACGLRRGEILRLNVADLNAEARRLRVEGKGGVDRMMPVSPRAIADVREYLAARQRVGHDLRPGAALFVTSTAEPARLKKEHVDALFRAVNRRLRKSGRRGRRPIPRVYPHLFRHSFAAALLRGGADVRHVQALLGHAEPETTARYLWLSRTEVQRQHAKAVERLLTGQLDP